MKSYFSGMISGFATCTLIASLIAIYVGVPITTTTNCDNSQELLVDRIDELYEENTALTKKLRNYEADEAYIKALPGADEDIAQKIIKASGALNVDPK